MAGSYEAMRATYRERETTFAVSMPDRADWERATRQQRQLAVAADAELRRRLPPEPWPPLRSADPPPAAEHAEHDYPSVAERGGVEDVARRIEELAARHREFAHRLAERQSVMIPAEDPDAGHLGPAFPAWAPPGRGAILQPPPPQIPPAGRILQHVADRDLDMEAAD